MSIMVRLKELEEAGEVFRFPAPKGFNAKRALFVSKPLRKALEGENSAVAHYKARAHIVRLFERWVKGDLIKVRMQGHKPGAFLAQLDPPPPDIWELRVTEPNPQFRVFCRFVDVDMIVATGVRTRAELGYKKTRTGRKSQAWNNVMFDCQAQWQGLFPKFNPHVGTEPEHFLTDYDNV